MKKMMLVESINAPRFERVIVAYKCGCSFFNDAWVTKSDAPQECPDHGSEIKAVSSEKVLGVRPETAATKPHTLKTNA